jgi:multidrug efflux pump subunit AcrB
MLISLVPADRRQRSVFRVIDELRDRLATEVPQAECEFIQVMQDTIADLSGNPEPLEVKLLGPEVRDLQSAADAVEAALEHVPGVVDVKNHVSFGSPSLTWAVDPEAAARLGLSTAQVAEQVTAQLTGGVATKLPEGNRMTDVRVRYARPWRANADHPAGDEPLFLVPAGSARPTRVVPLESVAQVSRVIAESEVERENQTPMVRVTASVAGRDLGSAARAVERAVAALPKRPGVRVEYGGQVESQRSAFDKLRIVFGVALGLVFLLLVVQFRSLLLPLVVLLALPFGQIGALHALHANHVALNISSGMGLILLVGLVVKNGIILVEYARQLRAEGHEPLSAVVEAARARLRPILMTTLAAILGLLPLARGIGAGSELQRPLAIAVIGGLAVSTLFTLVAVPLGLSLLGRRSLAEEKPDAA